MRLKAPCFLLLLTSALAAEACSGDDNANGSGVTAGEDASPGDDDVANDDDTAGDDDSSDDDGASDDDGSDDDSAGDDDGSDDDSAGDDDGSDDDLQPDSGADDAADASVPMGGAGGASSGGAGGEGAGGGAGTGGSGGQAAMCFPASFSCTSSNECCSGLCDPRNDACVSVVETCTTSGQNCVSPTECCSLSCGADGQCRDACISDYGSCSDDEECCGANCLGGVCQPLNFECKTSGNECSDGSECCSKTCTGGRCDIAPSYCVQHGDVCSHASDCCTSVCNIADGMQIGTCGDPPQGAANCSGTHGTVCAGCGECCSSLCAPYGPTGTFICQPPSGCHVTGELCHEDSDCCGGIPAEDYPNPEDALPGAGRVYCDIRGDNDVGVCRNSMGCSPQGNICHYQNYECSNSSAPNSCCGGVGNSGVCQLDFLGIPRCYGLDECRDEGEICSSAADCCNGFPCVPSDDGFLRCLTEACVPSGGSCTTVSDCCPGSTCIVAIGSVSGVCGEPSDPPGGEGGTPGTGGSGGGGTGPGGSSNGGTPGAGGTPSECSSYGQLCDANQTCCNAVPCTAGRCIFPPN